MNSYRARPLVFFILALLLLSACAPNQPVANQATIDVEAIYTAAAKTLEAQLNQSGFSPVSGGLSAPPTNTPAPTWTPLASPTPLATITPAFTPTRPVFFVTAEETTNCRSGPGLDYEKIGSLRAGTTAQVYGTNDQRSWWMIQNPNNQYEYCWVWDQTTTIEGDPYRIPYQPAPELPTATATPEINLRISFVGLNKCEGGKTAILKVDNTSAANLHSLEITIIDLDENRTLSGPVSSDAPFLGTEAECPPGGDMLPAGKVGYIGGLVGSPVPHGHTLQAKIALCTDNGLLGGCIEQRVEFVAP